MKRLLQSLFAVAALAAALPAAARHDGRVALGVRDLDRGRSLDLHWHDGQRFVAGEMGSRYAITLNNLTPRRLLVVLSVDGVNAVSGETAHPEQAGYVLGPFQQAEIQGWRKSLSEVAAFRFAALPHSYAAQTGRPDNVGVIGIAVFEEDRPLPPPPSPPVAKQSAPAGSASAPALLSSAPPTLTEPGALADSSKSSERRAQAPVLGTAHGERRYDPVASTVFRRASRHPAEVQRLYYDSRDNLIAAGVLPPPWRHRPPHRADPFPLGFVPDPR
jgi:hypothetical protein